MMLNGVLAALVAITAASGFVAPWAAIVIGARLRLHRRRRRDLRRADRHRRPDRRGRRARHVRRLGHARHRPVRGARAGEEPRHRHGRARLHGLVPPARRAGARARRGRRASPSRASFGGPLGDEEALGHPRRGGVGDAQASTSPSTACGAIPSSTSRSRAGTTRGARRRGSAAGRIHGKRRTSSRGPCQKEPK